MNDPRRAAVAHELEHLASPGGLLDPDGDRSTSTHSRTARALRQQDVAQQFLALQPSVALGGRAAIVTAGAPGAGKTTWLETSGLGGGFRYIDPDVVKDMLLDREDVRSSLTDLLRHDLPDGHSIMPRELAGLVHAESASIAYNLMQYSLRRGENVVVSGTLGWAELPDRLLAELDSHGYGDLTIVDIEVPQTVAMERALSRWWQTRSLRADPLGGRFVRRQTIASLYASSGPSICHANAVYLFERSPVETTALVSIDGVNGTTTERRKISGDELPNLDVQLADELAADDSR